jgi:hypothetical protein
MDQRAQYFLQVLEKIGSPLLSAVIENPATEPAQAEEAQTIASLLARTVQASIDIGKTINFAALGEQGDSLRLALAALASGIISSQYKTSGKMPAEADIKRFTTALQAVLTFSDNFTADSQATERLNQLHATGAPADALQMTVQFIQAFVPVVNAVGTFSFGQNEQTMVMEVAQRLLGSATSIAASIPGARSEMQQRAAELAMVRALAQLYAASHKAETTRLMTLSEDQRQPHGSSIDRVWQGFDLRLQMLTQLASSILQPDKGSASAGGGEKLKPAATVVPEVKAPPQPPESAAKPAIFSSPAPPQTPTQTQAAPPVSPPPATSTTAQNPLSMFAKKPETPAPETPPGTSEAPVPPATPPTNPPLSGSNPMAFFKGPVNKTDET